MKKLDIYISEDYEKYEKVDSFVLDIQPKTEDEYEYYAKQLSNYFHNFYKIIDPTTKSQYIITTEDLKLILTRDNYHLGSHLDEDLYPNRVRFVSGEKRIKYFSDIYSHSLR